MSEYTSIIATAKKLITKKGQLVQVSRKVDGIFDPVTGKDTTATEALFSTNAVVGNFKLSQINNTVILQGDLRILMEATTEPKMGDFVTSVQGKAKVLDVNMVGPSGEAIIYVLQARY